MSETIESGGLLYEAAWLRCLAAATFKMDEAFVRIQAIDVSDKSPLAFLVDRELVMPSELPSGKEVHGRVKVMMVGQDNGKATVQVPGEPISYGPRIVVSTDQLVVD